MASFPETVNALTGINLIDTFKLSTNKNISKKPEDKAKNQTDDFIIKQN